MNETSSKNEITSGIIWKQLLLFFFPILLGSFFQQLYNTIDAVIVGRFVGKMHLPRSPVPPEWSSTCWSTFLPG